MGKKYKTKKSNLLCQRLQEALERGSKVWLETDDRSLSGIPINLTEQFVELLVLISPYEEDDDDTYERTTWLLRISSISAIAYHTEYWSKDKFDRLIETDAIGSPQDD